MHPVLFEINGWPVYSYGVLLAAATMAPTCWVSAARPSAEHDEWVCPPPDTGCEQSDELRYDGIHFTDEGTAIVLPWLLERMFATA